jgi:hypothetical protein
MESYTSNQKSIGGLIRRLADDAQTAIRKELELAKVELSERVAKYGRHTAWIAAAVSVAYGGIIILFMCLGVLFAWLLIRGGTEEILAVFAGFGIMALLAIAMIGLLVRALATSEFTGALFLVGMAVWFAWTIGGFIKRNRPCRYSFDALPATLLP